MLCHNLPAPLQSGCSPGCWTGLPTPRPCPRSRRCTSSARLRINCWWVLLLVAAGAAACGFGCCCVWWVLLGSCGCTSLTQWRVSCLWVLLLRSWVLLLPLPDGGGLRKWDTCALVNAPLTPRHCRFCCPLPGVSGFHAQLRPCEWRYQARQHLALQSTR